MATRPWTPADDPDCVEYWTPTAGLTSAGGVVSQWLGQILGTNAAQAAAGTRPTVSSRNGVASIYFNGSQFLQFTPPAAFPSGSGALTVALSGYRDATGATSGIAFSYGKNAADQMPSLGALSGKVASTYYGSDLISNAAWSLQDRFSVWQVPGGSSPTETIYVDGVLAGSTTLNTRTTVNVVGYIGRFIADGFNWIGHIQNVAVRRAVFATDALRQTYEGWDSWSTGRNGANLPANHPYKAAAPTVDAGGGIFLRRRPMMLIAS